MPISFFFCLKEGEGEKTNCALSRTLRKKEEEEEEEEEKKCRNHHLRRSGHNILIRAGRCSNNSRIEVHLCRHACS